MLGLLFTYAAAILRVVRIEKDWRQKVSLFEETKKNKSLEDLAVEITSSLRDIDAQGVSELAALADDAAKLVGSDNRNSSGYGNR